MSKRFITLLLVLTMVALCSVAIYAQDQNAGQGGEHRGERMGRGPMNSQAMLDHLTKELTLTKDQQDKIKPILDDQQKQVQALRDDTSSDQQTRRSKMQDIHKSTVDQIKAVLNSDQQTKFDEMQKKMMENGPGGRRGAGDHPHGDQPPPPPPQL
jgi:Spy/CpxP family protein refolding chaperone